MKSLLLATAAWLLPCTGPAGELQRDRLPSDVDFVVHLDLEGLEATELFRQALALGRELDLDFEELAEIEAEFGIDPFEDVRAITLFKVRTEEEPTVVLLSATDALDRALARLKTEEGYHPLTSGGVPLHTWGEGAGERMFAYVHALGDELVAVLSSNEASAVRAARVLRGEEPSHAKGGTALALAPARGSFLFLAAAGLPGLDGLPPASRVFGLAQGIQFDLGEAGGFLRAHVGVTTRTAEDAQHVANVVNGFVSLARLAGAEAGEALELLDGLRLAARGNLFTVDYEFEVERLLEILCALEADDAADEHEADGDVRIRIK